MTNETLLAIMRILVAYINSLEARIRLHEETRQAYMGRELCKRCQGIVK